MLSSLIPSTLRASLTAFYRLISRISKLNILLVVNCVLLLLNLLFYAYNSNLAFAFIRSPVDNYFLSPLDPDDGALLDQTFRVFVETLTAANVSFFIFSGTLLGSVRHHGRIPWDDDIDVIIDVRDKYRVVEALTDRSLDSFGLYTGGITEADYVYQWKFYPKAGYRVLHRRYRSPYVDVFFYFENETHIWNGSPYFKHSEIWQKSHVFPLRMRPFGDVMVPAPCNVDAFLGRNFNASVCRSRDFSHYYEVPLPFRSVSVPCDRLAHLYPFVRRSRIDAHQPFVREVLMLQNMELKQFISQLPC